MGNGPSVWLMCILCVDQFYTEDGNDDIQRIGYNVLHLHRCHFIAMYSFQFVC